MNIDRSEIFPMRRAYRSTLSRENNDNANGEREIKGELLVSLSRPKETRLACFMLQLRTSNDFVSVMDL